MVKRNAGESLSIYLFFNWPESGLQSDINGAAGTSSAMNLILNSGSSYQDWKEEDECQLRQLNYH